MDAASKPYPLSLPPPLLPRKLPQVRRLEPLSPLSTAASASARPTSGTPPRTLLPSLSRRLCWLPRTLITSLAASNPYPLSRLCCLCLSLLSLPPPYPLSLSRRLEPLSPLSPLLAAGTPIPSPAALSPLSPAASKPYPLSLPPPLLPRNLPPGTRAATTGTKVRILIHETALLPCVLL
jgi:hypothetical protein